MSRLLSIVVRWWPVVLAAWGALTLALLALAPSFQQVATFDNTAFLPADSPSIAGQELMEEGWPDNDLANAMTIVLERRDGELTDADRDHLAGLVDWLRSDEAPETVDSVTTHLDDPALEQTMVAEDGQAMFLQAGLSVSGYSPPASDAVERIRDHLAQADAPEGLDAYVTGSVGIAADDRDATNDTVEQTTYISLVLVTIILLLVYRSPVAPLVPLLVIGVASQVSLGVVSLLAEAGMQVSSLFEAFSIVVIFGVGTDYCLFLMSRYHEELVTAEDAGLRPSRRLRVGTLTATALVMVAVLGGSAGTTVVGFSAQAAAEFGLYRTMGPALAISIVITLLVALTLAPALMRLFGRNLFWPESWGTPTRLPGHADPLVLQRADELGFDDLRDEAAATTDGADSVRAGAGPDGRAGEEPGDPAAEGTGRDAESGRDAETGRGADGQVRR